ncbi:putative lysine decarboxylase [Neoconidiobolus thromboides FSU 785]|nr:putative lysine decarboxylase [Neoconidiobolus thromboides FSU 785]
MSSNKQLENLTLEEEQEHIVQEVQSLNQHFICVFCGSGLGNDPEYERVAIALGKELVKRGYGLVYGGGNGGLMGAVAKSVASEGGKVISIYPWGFREFCKVDFAYKNILVKDMHQRKKLMARLSFAFLALPGGLGTFEEIMEMATWNQLSIHNKYLGLINTNNFYSIFDSLLEHGLKEGFISEGSRKLITTSEDYNELLNQIQNFNGYDYKAPFTWQ